MDHLLVLRNPNLPKVKTNGIFNTDLLLFQYWLLEMVWIGSIHYVTKAENFKYYLSKTNQYFLRFSINIS